MKMLIKNERGVSLISLAVAIIILGIIVSMLVYNVKDTKEIEKLTNMYTDIDNIGDRISNYYSRYGALPVLKNVDLSSDTTINKWISEKGTDNSPLGANDTNTFYIIDLKALENLTLNYGKDFEKISGNVISNDNDIYVINENSHNIFYLKGIKINNDGNVKTYYTNLEKDKEKVDLRYFNGIKIPDGFEFESGNSKNDLKIENSGHDEYIWANTVDGTYTVDFSGSNATLTQTVSLTDTTYTVDLLTGQSKEDLIKSNNEFGGFYYTIVDSSTINVYYLSVAESDNWGPTYDVEGIYKDKNGDTAYIPAGFKISRLSYLNTIKNGLVIKNNSTGDEYVWIDVPDGILENCDTLEKVENALKEYANNYRQDGYEDTWYDGCGFLQKNDYNTLRNKMLQSIKTNGGFYIGRYEAGTNKARSSGTSTETASVICTTNGYGKPLSQKDKYPYNYITVNQAQGLAQMVKPANANYETSLMFGIQWDLVCKFIENTGAKTYHEIAEDSKEWGNYKDSEFLITSDNAKQGSWTNISKGATKNLNSEILLTTGSSNKNSINNIYDFAGNVHERTLEQQISRSDTVVRGGGYKSTGSYANCYSLWQYKDNCIDYIGFRVALFK